MSDHPKITISPSRALVDVPLEIHLTGFVQRQTITIRAHTVDGSGVKWESQAVYEADGEGKVDLNKQAPVSGAFPDSGPMGLIGSMVPKEQANRYARFTFPSDLSPWRIAFDVLVNNDVVDSGQAERLLIADGVKRIVVRENGLFGTLFLPPIEDSLPAITFVSGSGGGLDENRAALYASHGYAGFALAYFNYETLPKFLLDIPLEYFKTAIDYLQANASIDPERLAIWGASRGGELALLLASTFPEYKAVIAQSPSGVVWGGIGNDPAEGVKPAWMYRDEAIPYTNVDPGPDFAYMDEYKERGEAMPGTRGYLEYMQRNKSVVKKAEIPVEKINGAVLLISGEDDQMWPSAQLADIAMARFKKFNFKKPYSHISYRGAGHKIQTPFVLTTMVNSIHPLAGILLALGGTPASNYHASVDSWQKKLSFLASNL